MNHVIGIQNIRGIYVEHSGHYVLCAIHNDFSIVLRSFSALDKSYNLCLRGARECSYCKSFTLMCIQLLTDGIVFVYNVYVYYI